MLNVECEHIPDLFLFTRASLYISPQSSSYFMVAVLLESVILVVLGKKDMAMRSNDAISSVSAGIISSFPLYVQVNKYYQNTIICTTSSSNRRNISINTILPVSRYHI